MFKSCSQPLFCPSSHLVSEEPSESVLGIAWRLAWWLCACEGSFGVVSHSSLFINLSSLFGQAHAGRSHSLGGCCGRGAAVIMECNNNLTSRPLYDVGWVGRSAVPFFLFIISLQGVRLASHGKRLRTRAHFTKSIPLEKTTPTNHFRQDEACDFR